MHFLDFEHDLRVGSLILEDQWLVESDWLSPTAKKANSSPAQFRSSPTSSRQVATDCSRSATRRMMLLRRMPGVTPRQVDSAQVIPPDGGDGVAPPTRIISTAAAPATKFIASSMAGSCRRHPDRFHKASDPLWSLAKI